MNRVLRAKPARRAKPVVRLSPARDDPGGGPDACIREDRDLPLEGGTALVAFPGSGLAATMAAAYLADDLQLVPIGAMECDAWPSVAIIEHGRVVEPVRLLARPSRRKAGRLVVFLSEVAVNEPAVRAVSTSILQWCTRRGIRTIVSLESATVEAEPNEVPSVRLWGVSEQPNGNRRLAKAGMPLAVEGVVGGLTGCLLRQGLDSPIEVIGLVESCHASEPDLRGAQALVEFLARFLHLPVRVGRLHKDTQAFQKHLVDVERRRQANDPAAAADERDFI